jgi:hypothetical protein
MIERISESIEQQNCKWAVKVLDLLSHLRSLASGAERKQPLIPDCRIRLYPHACAWQKTWANRRDVVLVGQRCFNKSIAVSGPGVSQSDGGTLYGPSG